MKTTSRMNDKQMDLLMKISKLAMDGNKPEINENEFAMLAELGGRTHLIYNDDITIYLRKNKSSKILSIRIIGYENKCFDTHTPPCECGKLFRVEYFAEYFQPKIQYTIIK